MATYVSMISFSRFGRAAVVDETYGVACLIGEMSTLPKSSSLPLKSSCLPSGTDRLPTPMFHGASCKFQGGYT